MTLTEAVNLVCVHLQRQQITFTLSFARALDEKHFQIDMHEVYPENKMLVFRVEPEEVAHCWKVVEVA